MSCCQCLHSLSSPSIFLLEFDMPAIALVAPNFQKFNTQETTGVS